LKQSSKGELIDSLFFDGENAGGRIHSVGEYVAAGERDDPLLSERVVAMASKRRRMTFK